ncbi:MAG: hypothetical protein NT094_05740 [Candidatus Staskawiczbacteria bacterium]|nr:hypothetical protein [Candidatus Staskawiczbacteria bacterium]
MHIKSLFLTAVLATAVLCLSPAGALAAGLTSVQVSAIISLLQSFGADATTIANVQTALNGDTPVIIPNTWCHTFNANLGVGQKAGNPEVKALMEALKKEDIFPRTYETDGAFDENLASMVVQFQEKYASEILTQNNLKHGTGYVGVATRKKLNSLYGCVTTSICSNLYWLDNTNKTCQLTKQFCGAFMYYGLQTFKDQQDCLDAASNNSTQPSITVTSPNGGETWQNGTQQQIKWNIPSGYQTSNISITIWKYTLPCTTNVCNMGGVVPIYTIVDSVNAGLGSYTWNVGDIKPSAYSGTLQNLPTGQYIISACIIGANYCDTSNVPFTIIPTTPPSGIIYFYWQSCPHCAQVDNYITANNIAQKVSFTKLETFNNTDNDNLMKSKATLCGLSTNAIGVPFVWDGSKCYIGTPDVINFFSQYILK